MKRMLFWLCFSLIFVTVGCGSEENIDVTGTWSGTWDGPTTSGGLMIEFIQEENILRGECTLNGNPCLSNCNIWGIIDDEGNTTFLGTDIDLPTEEVEALDPLTPREDFVAIEMTHIAKMIGAFSENQLEVDFDIINWEFCSGAIGTFSLTRN